MTDRYVRSLAAGAADGTSWADAYLTLAAAVTASAAGDTIYVSEDHAESAGTSVNINSPGTRASPLRIICVDHLGSVPPVSADIRDTAQVTTTSTGNIAFQTNDSAIISEGVIFHASGTGQIYLANGDRINNKFRNCSLRLSSGSSQRMNFGSSGSTSANKVVLENTTMQFGHISQQVLVGCDLSWKNTPTALLGATMPTTFVGFLNDAGASVDLDGVDLSALGSGKTLFASSADATAASVRLSDCKIDAAVTISAAPANRGTVRIDGVRIAGDGTNYRQFRYRYDGTLTEETTIVRTGGASNGTTTIAWKIVTNADAEWSFPFESLPIAIWNDTTGASVTATVEGIWGGGAVPNNDEVWLEVQYLGDASSPQASFANDSKADVLATGAAQTSSAESWGGSTTAFKLGVTFTPQQKGWILARVMCAKPSDTFYIDPKVTLS